jgi:hypothetical protein
VPDEDDFGSSELHKTIPGGERVLIRRMRPDDMALYRDFLRDVSAEDLRLRFFARIAELSAAEIEKLSHLDYRHEMAFIALDEDTGHMLGLVRLKDEQAGCAPLPLMVFGEAQVHRLIWQRLWDLRTNLNIGRDRPAGFLPGVDAAPDVAGRSETRVLRRLHRHGRALAEGAVKQEPLASRFG